MRVNSNNSRATEVDSNERNSNKSRYIEVNRNFKEGTQELWKKIKQVRGKNTGNARM